MNMKKIISLILILSSLLYICINIYGEDKKKEDKNTDALIEEWKSTLKYGIDSEVLEVIRKIKERHETALDNDMLTVLEETFNSDVRKAIIEIFSDRKDVRGIETVEKILSDYDNEPDDLLIASMNYIKSISKNIKDKSLQNLRLSLKDIIEYGNKNIASLAVKTIAYIGDPEIEDYLLKKYDSDDTTESLKNAIVIALGELKSKKAVERLIDSATNTDNPRILRMYACQALGEIGDSRAIPVLKKILSEKDVLIRIYAVAAISKFKQDKESIKLLMDGLRDSNWKVRLYCARALGEGKVEQATEILKYKVIHDPIKQVRKESMKALESIGSKNVNPFIRKVFIDKNENEEIRLEALKIMVEKDLANSLDAIKQVIKESNADYNKKFLERVVQIITSQKNTSIKSLLKVFLNSNDPIIRIYAMRGIALNNFKDMRTEIERISENDEMDYVKKEASHILKEFK